MHSVKPHVSVFGSYSFSAAPTTQCDPIQRKLWGKKDIEYARTPLLQFCSFKKNILARNYILQRRNSWTDFEVKIPAS